MSDKKQSVAGGAEKSSPKLSVLFARFRQKFHLGSHGKHKVGGKTNGTALGGAGESVSAPSTSAGPPGNTETAKDTEQEKTTAAGSPPSPPKPRSAPSSPTSPTSPNPTSPTETASPTGSLSARRTGPRPVVPGLPRQQTFARQISEKRVNLQPVEEPRPGRISSRSLQPLSQSRSTLGEEDRKNSDRAAIPSPTSTTSPTSPKSPKSPTSTASPTAHGPAGTATAGHPGPRLSHRFYRLMKVA